MNHTINRAAASRKRRASHLESSRLERSSSSNWHLACAAALAGALGAADLQAQNTFTALGVYVGNPNGNDANAEASFESNYSAFVSSMGQGASTMDTFVDYTQPISTWASNAGWAAWSMANSAPVKNLVPVVSVGLVDNANGENSQGWNEAGAVAMMNAVASGSYDSVFTGVVNSYLSQGYTHIYLRIGWEMDGFWEPWYATKDSTAAAAFVAAYQHVATITRQISGINVKTVWCPSCINWTAVDVMNTYPGDQYVDVIGPDLYSTVYPNTTLDWGTGAFDSSSNWWQNAVNREHYWDYPGFTQWNMEADSNGFGFVEALNLALSHHKPFGLSETGAGGDGSSSGPVDESDFPAYLAARLSAAIGQGLQLAYVNVWDVNVWDGSWDFSHGSKPNEAVAWKQFAATMALAQNGDTARKLEAESLTVANYQAQGGGSVSIQSGDAYLSNSAALVLTSNTVGDYVTLVAPAVQAGTYEVRVGLKKTASAGEFQLQAGQAGNFAGTAVNVGSVQDELSQTSWQTVYPEIDLGALTVNATGDEWFRFNVVGTNSSGNSYNDSLCIDYILLVPLTKSASLPNGWSDEDIGWPYAAGSGSYDGSTGTWTVLGGGNDIWTNIDSFNFASETVTGDQTIVAKVTRLDYTQDWAKAGVMLRDSADASSMFVDVVATESNGVVLQWRNAYNGQCGSLSVGGIPAPSSSSPVWVKLVKSGSTFTGYCSTDGSTWSNIGSTTVSFSNSAYLAGLAVTSHNYWVTTTAAFQSVQVSSALIPDGNYRLSPRHAPNEALDVSGGPGATADGTNVEIWSYWGGSNQIWHVHNLGNNVIELSPSNAPSEALDVEGAGAANGTNVWIWTYSGAADGKWQVIPTDSGYNQLSPTNAPGECLDVNGGPSATGDGTNVQIWQYVGGANQQWMFETP